MALVIHIENQLHERGRAVLDDGANTFLNLARRLSRSGTRGVSLVPVNFVPMRVCAIELCPPDRADRLVDGGGVVVDVRADDRIPRRDAQAFAVTARACAEVGRS